MGYFSKVEPARPKIAGTIPYSVFDNASEEEKEKLLTTHKHVVADDHHQQFIIVR